MMTGLAGAFCIWGLVLPIMAKQTYKNLPQGWLFCTHHGPRPCRSSGLKNYGKINA